MSLKFFARTGPQGRIAGTARRGWGAVAIVGASVLASCGGGSGQVEPFKPTRVLAFGDELSVIEADGRKYSVNAFKQITVNGVVTDDIPNLDCARNPLWIQTVAGSFGLAFDRCLGTATAATGQVHAQVGQKVADLAAQIAGVQGNALGEKDLALVMIGMHDVLELYAQYPGVDQGTLLAQAGVRGTSLGAQINQLATSGPAVVVLTVPDIGKSPFALAQNVSSGDTTRATLITALVEKFNNSMSVELINDGRLIGLVYADIELQNMVKFPASYGLVNVIASACLDSAPLPGCTTATLQAATATAAAATSATWLWADSLRLSPAGQSRLGVLAEGRARNNPF
jgi:outer membrane lipase/esterase